MCASADFKKRGESKIALDDYYRTNAKKEESHYNFCVRCGWKKYIDQMIAIDYLILTISLILKGNYGFFSTVSMVAVIVFAGIKAIENILNEIE